MFGFLIPAAFGLDIVALHLGGTERKLIIKNDSHLKISVQCYDQDWVACWGPRIEINHDQQMQVLQELIINNNRPNVEVLFHYREHRISHRIPYQDLPWSGTETITITGREGQVSQEINQARQKFEAQEQRNIEREQLLSTFTQSCSQIQNHQAQVNLINMNRNQRLSNLQQQYGEILGRLNESRANLVRLFDGSQTSISKDDLTRIQAAMNTFNTQLSAMTAMVSQIIDADRAAIEQERRNAGRAQLLDTFNQSCQQIQNHQAQVNLINMNRNQRLSNLQQQYGEILGRLNESRANLVRLFDGSQTSISQDDLTRIQAVMNTFNTQLSAMTGMVSQIIDADREAIEQERRNEEKSQLLDTFNQSCQQIQNHQAQVNLINMNRNQRLSNLQQRYGEILGRLNESRANLVRLFDGSQTSISQDDLASTQVAMNAFNTQLKDLIDCMTNIIASNQAAVDVRRNAASSQLFNAQGAQHGSVRTMSLSSVRR